MENNNFDNFFFNHTAFDQSPIGKMRAAASATKQLFDAYVQAGFTEDQALTLIGNIVGAAAQKSDQGDGDV